MDLFELDKSKLAAFGSWLTEQTIQREASVFAACADPKRNSDSIRLEYGKMEAYKFILQAFVELYQGELKDFRKNYLHLEEETEESDGVAKQPNT